MIYVILIMKELGLMIKRKDMEYIDMAISEYIKVFLRMMSDVEMEKWNIIMVMYMKDFGKMIKEMEGELRRKLMVLSMTLIF